MCTIVTVSVHEVQFYYNMILVFSTHTSLIFLIGGPTVDPTMKLSLLTPKEAVSNLDFTLSFTVSNGGPSRLRCVIGSNTLLFSETLSRGPTVSQLSREVIRSHYINSSYPDMTRVSITRTGQLRAAATYTCTVFVEGRTSPANRLTYNFIQMGSGVSTASITGECFTTVLNFTARPSSLPSCRHSH